MSCADDILKLSILGVYFVFSWIPNVVYMLTDVKLLVELIMLVNVLGCLLVLFKELVLRKQLLNYVVVSLGRLT